MLANEVASEGKPSAIGKIIHAFRRAKIHAGYWFIRKMEISKRELEPVPNIFNRIGDVLLKPFVNKNLIPQILMGPFSFQIFRVSHDIGVFDYLNEHPGATKEEISQQLKLEHYPVEILLLGLTGLKLLKKVGRKYYNSAVVSIVTQDISNKFTYFFPKYMRYAQHLLIPGIHHLQESLQENKPVGLKKMFGDEAVDYYYELSKNETANNYFAQHMSAFSQINAQRLANHTVFNKINSLLDVGGGIGEVAVSIANLHPNLQITVYDHPMVAELANKNFQAAGMDSQLNAIGVDINESDFPENYEGVLFSHFIDIFPPDKNKLFFRRAFKALKSKGHIIVYTPVVNDSETGPLVNCLLGVYFLCLANGQGRFYSCAQISQWLKDVGYVDIKIQHLPSSEAIIIGMKP